MTQEIVNPASAQRSDACPHSRWRRAMLVAICGAAGLFFAVSAGALARVSGGSRGATRPGTGIIGPHTTPHSYQPFASYTGQDSWVTGHPSAPLRVVVDRRGATPKVASVLGAIPTNYSCGAKTVFDFYVDIDLIDRHREVPIQHGSFEAANLPDRFATYQITGTVTGNVHIAAHGPGKGTSTISGTLTAAQCPSVHLPFHVKFRRTYSGMRRGGLV